jgi:hypothetical protein
MKLWSCLMVSSNLDWMECIVASIFSWRMSILAFISVGRSSDSSLADACHPHYLSITYPRGAATSGTKRWGTRVITETDYSVSSRHTGDKGKEIIIKCIECIIHEGLPGQIRHWLQFVVDKQLRQHEQESKGIHSTDKTMNTLWEPSFMWFIEERAYCSTKAERVEDIWQVFHALCVELLCLLLCCCQTLR